MDKGISNGGWTPDYEGVIFSDGTVVLRWLTAFRSHSVWSNWDDFYQVHGHPEYGTRIEFDDDKGWPGLPVDVGTKTDRPAREILV